MRFPAWGTLIVRGLPEVRRRSWRLSVTGGIVPFPLFTISVPYMPLPGAPWNEQKYPIAPGESSFCANERPALIVLLFHPVDALSGITLCLLRPWLSHTTTLPRSTVSVCGV